MKLLKSKILIMLTATVMLSSCSQRMFDFTIVSTKNHSLDVDKSKGIRVEGKSMGVFGIGRSLKDAMDKALQSAGAEYDLLIDGVVSLEDYFFVAGYKVVGIAVKSSEMRAELGEDGFKTWCDENNVFDPTAEIIQE